MWSLPVALFPAAGCTGIPVSPRVRNSVRAADPDVIQVDEVAGRRAVVLALDLDLADNIVGLRAMAIYAEVFSVEVEPGRVGSRVYRHDQAVPDAASLQSLND